MNAGASLAAQRSQASIPQSDSEPFASLLDAAAPPDQQTTFSANDGSNNGVDGPATSDNVSATSGATNSTASSTGNGPPVAHGAGRIGAAPTANGKKPPAGLHGRKLHNAAGKAKAATAQDDAKALAGSAAGKAANDPNAGATDGGTAGTADSGAGDSAAANSPSTSSASSPDGVETAVVRAANAFDLTVGGATLEPPTKDAGKSDDKSAAPGASAASAGQAQPSAAGSPQPVVGAIALGSVSNTASTPANAQAIVDELSKSRLKLPVPGASGQDTPADNAKDAAAKPDGQSQPASGDAASQTTTAASSSANSAQASSNQNAGAAQAQAQTQTQAQTDSSAVLAGQAPARAQTTSSGITSRDGVGETTPSGTAGLTGAQAARGLVGANGLPNFGFLAANAAATSAAAGSAAAPDASVPITGLAVTIASRAQAGSNQFDIRLDPPELGRIDVRLDVDGNGQVTSHVTVDRPDTLQLLQSQQPQLQRALEQAGLKTGDNGLQFTLRDQSFTGQNGAGGNPQNGARQHTARLVVPERGLSSLQTTQAYARWSRASGLDIRV